MSKAHPAVFSVRVIHVTKRQKGTLYKKKRFVNKTFKSELES